MGASATAIMQHFQQQLSAVVGVAQYHYILFPNLCQLAQSVFPLRTISSSCLPEDNSSISLELYLSGWKSLFFCATWCLLTCSRLWFLWLVFPPVDPGYVPLESPASQDWVEAISYVQEQFSDQRRLLACLRIYFYDLDAKEEDIQNTVAVQKRIILSLSRLGKNGIIDRCFVFNSWHQLLNDLLMIEQSLKRQIMDVTTGIIVSSRRETSKG